MRNIKLIIEYDGSNYNGWQVQHKRRNFRTVQSEIENALKRILQEKVNLIGSGRTDSGVHALGQVVNLKTNSKIACDKLQKGLNAILPDDIVIKSIDEVKSDFHARFDAKSKIYRYTILNRPFSSALEKHRVFFVPYKLNFNLIKSESRGLIGKHDFKAFQATDKKEHSSIRNIKSIKISKEDHFIIIDFHADGFLYKMIRNIVGTLVDIGRGRLQKGSIKRILESRNRRLAGKTAPARGLCLLKVSYDI